VWDFDWPAEAILPAMSVSELLDVTKVYSHAATLGRTPRIAIARPFRAPHHTITHIALVGGGGVGFHFFCRFVTQMRFVTAFEISAPGTSYSLFLGLFHCPSEYSLL
jgi:hypothetical protein